MHSLNRFAAGVALCVWIMFGFLPLSAAEPSLTLANALAVYAPGEEIRGELLLPAGEIAGAQLYLRDFAGAQQPVPAAQVTKAEGKLSFRLAPPAALGFYRLEYAAANQTPEQVKVVRSFAVVPPVAADLPAHPFGAMVFPHIAYPWTDREKDAQLMQRIGMRWVRTGRIRWDRAQRAAEAPIDWNETEKELALWRKYGMQVIATPFQTPVWASQGKDDPEIDARTRSLMSPLPEYLPLMQTYLRELAKRYGKDIAFYEIGNEVDANIFWMGSLDSYYKRDQHAIMKDYYEAFRTIRQALHEGDPRASVCPNTTGHLPEGVHYRPWCKTMMELGLGKEMDSFSSHYDPDMPEVNRIFAEYGVKVPFIITEIGGIARGKMGISPYDPSAPLVIRGDWEQCVAQYSYGAKAMCKFLFREQPTYGGEGSMACALLGYDFSVTPAYPSFATLIRTLAGATYVRELNLVRQVSAGYLKAYAFTRGGQPFTVLLLKDSDSATVELPTKSATLEVVDVMGNRQTIAAQSGRVITTMPRGLPLVVYGALDAPAGEPKYPAYRMVKSVTIPIANPSFEEIADGRPQGWRVMSDERKAEAGSAPGFTVTSDEGPATEGARTLLMAATTKTKWYGVVQKLDYRLFPVPSAGQYITLQVSYDMKAEQVRGIGGGMSVSLRKNSGERVQWFDADRDWLGGTTDWQHVTFRREIRQITPGVQQATLELYLGCATGKIWIDNVKMQVELWDKE